MIYTDGSVYEGMWKEGKRHGPGTLFLPNGDIFQGEYALDLKDGPGTFFYVSKNKRYDGVWSKDMGKCGLYGDIEAGEDGSSELPQLTMLEPMGVLEAEAYALQEQREIEHSRLRGNSSRFDDSGNGFDDDMYDGEPVGGEEARQSELEGLEGEEDGYLDEEDGDEFDIGDDY